MIYNYDFNLTLNSISQNLKDELIKPFVSLLVDNNDESAYDKNIAVVDLRKGKVRKSLFSRKLVISYNGEVFKQGILLNEDFDVLTPVFSKSEPRDGNTSMLVIKKSVDKGIIKVLFYLLNEREFIKLNILDKGFRRAINPFLKIRKGKKIDMQKFFVETSKEIKFI